MNQNGQPPLPETYTLPAPLVSTIYQILSQVPAGNAARAFVQLENQIARQNQAHQALAQQVDEGNDADHAPTYDEQRATAPEPG